MKKLRLIAEQTARLISTHRRRLISIAVGAVIGAVIGGVIEGLDYAVFLADLHHRYGIDVFEFGNPDYLEAKVFAGAMSGVLGGLAGALAGALKAFGRAQRTVVRAAGWTVCLAVTACVACVALAGFGVAVINFSGPLGVFTLIGTLGALFIYICGYAAGVVVGAVGTRG